MQAKHAVDGGSGSSREQRRAPAVSDEVVQRANAAYLAAWRPSWWARQFFARSSRFEDWPEEVRREHLHCIRAALAAAMDSDREVDTSVG
jgi:hypothetical protein